MKLKLIKNQNSNSIEATFYEEVESVTSIIVNKEIEGEVATVKEDKNIIINEIEHCQSYSDLQIDLLRQTAKYFNTPISKEQEEIIADVIKNIVLPTKEELKAIEAEKEKNRILCIKAEAGRVITEKYSDIKQRNILMSGDVDKIKIMNDYIFRIREISNKAEEDGLEYNQIEWWI